MKTTLLAAIAALGLVGATASHASEGNGDPFPFRASGVTTSVTPHTYAADTGSAAYPDPTRHPFRVVIAGGSNVLPANGSEGAVQTANSLPRASMEGTVAYDQAESVQRYLAQGIGTTRLDEASNAAQAGEASEAVD